METVRILWTGGWDSTYRLVELSMRNIHIVPVYILDKGRKSRNIEISTMRKILSALRNKKGTQAEIDDVKIINMDKIPLNESITKAFNELSETVKLGSQYEWIGRLSAVYKGLEIGIEKPHGEYSGCMTVIQKYGKLIKVNDSYVVDHEQSSETLLLVFGNLSFPICKTTELEMVKNIKSWGYEDIMKMIWFCHTPINGKPCGFCRPCQQKMECNMEWLLPKQAQKRYKNFKAIDNINKFAAKGYKLAVKVCNKIKTVHK
ncbi:MAG: hypothetical protein IJM19_06620 [Ruminococcus sp.]|nr:hypothetical protein [Ruminococcus sp.]